MYNIRVRCVHATIVAVEKQEVLQIVSVSVALGTQHAMCMCHIVMWSAKFYNSFPHYLINGKISGRGGELLNIKCVF